MYITQVWYVCVCSLSDEAACLHWGRDPTPGALWDGGPGRTFSEEVGST